MSCLVLQGKIGPQNGRLLVSWHQGIQCVRIQAISLDLPA